MGRDDRTQLRAHTAIRSLTEVAAIVGTSVEAVRQAENRALRKLRRLFNETGFDRREWETD